MTHLLDWGRVTFNAHFAKRQRLQCHVTGRAVCRAGWGVWVVVCPGAYPTFSTSQQVYLSGGEMEPPTASTGIGYALVDLDPSLCWVCAFQSLAGLLFKLQRARCTWFA